MAGKEKTVKLVAIGVKRLNLPHSEHGSKAVEFDADGVAEVPVALANDILREYPLSVRKA